MLGSRYSEIDYKQDISEPCSYYLTFKDSNRKNIFRNRFSLINSSSNYNATLLELNSRLYSKSCKNSIFASSQDHGSIGIKQGFYRSLELLNNTEDLQLGRYLDDDRLVPMKVADLHSQASLDKRYSREIEVPYHNKIREGLKELRSLVGCSSDFETELNEENLDTFRNLDLVGVDTTKANSGFTSDSSESSSLSQADSPLPYNSDGEPLSITLRRTSVALLPSLDIPSEIEEIDTQIKISDVLERLESGENKIFPSTPRGSRPIPLQVPHEQTSTGRSTEADTASDSICLGDNVPMYHSSYFDQLLPLTNVRLVKETFQRSNTNGVSKLNFDIESSEDESNVAVSKSILKLSYARVEVDQETSQIIAEIQEKQSAEENTPQVIKRKSVFVEKRKNKSQIVVFSESPSNIHYDNNSIPDILLSKQQCTSECITPTKFQHYTPRKLNPRRSILCIPSIICPNKVDDDELSDNHDPWNPGTPRTAHHALSQTLPGDTIDNTLKRGTRRHISQPIFHDVSVASSKMSSASCPIIGELPPVTRTNTTSQNGSLIRSPAWTNKARVTMSKEPDSVLPTITVKYAISKQKKRKMSRTAKQNLKNQELESDQYSHVFQCNFFSTIITRSLIDKCAKGFVKKLIESSINAIVFKSTNFLARQRRSTGTSGHRLSQMRLLQSILASDADNIDVPISFIECESSLSTSNRPHGAEVRYKRRKRRQQQKIINMRLAMIAGFKAFHESGPYSKPKSTEQLKEIRTQATGRARTQSPLRRGLILAAISDYAKSSKRPFELGYGWFSGVAGRRATVGRRRVSQSVVENFKQSEMRTYFEKLGLEYIFTTKSRVYFERTVPTTKSFTFPALVVSPSVKASPKSGSKRYSCNKSESHRQAPNWNSPRFSLCSQAIAEMEGWEVPEQANWNNSPSLVQKNNLSDFMFRNHTQHYPDQLGAMDYFNDYAINQDRKHIIPASDPFFQMTGHWCTPKNYNPGFGYSNSYTNDLDYYEGDCFYQPESSYLNYRNMYNMYDPLVRRCSLPFNPYFASIRRNSECSLSVVDDLYINELVKTYPVQPTKNTVKTPKGKSSRRRRSRKPASSRWTQPKEGCRAESASTTSVNTPRARKVVSDSYDSVSNGEVSKLEKRSIAENRNVIADLLSMESKRKSEQYIAESPQTSVNSELQLRRSSTSFAFLTQANFGSLNKSRKNSEIGIGKAPDDYCGIPGSFNTYLRGDRRRSSVFSSVNLPSISSVISNLQKLTRRRDSCALMACLQSKPHHSQKSWSEWDTLRLRLLQPQGPVVSKIMEAPNETPQFNSKRPSEQREKEIARFEPRSFAIFQHSNISL